MKKLNYTSIGMEVVGTYLHADKVDITIRNSNDINDTATISMPWEEMVNRLKEQEDESYIFENCAKWLDTNQNDLEEMLTKWEFIDFQEIENMIRFSNLVEFKEEMAALKVAA